MTYLLPARATVWLLVMGLLCSAPEFAYCVPPPEGIVSEQVKAHIAAAQGATNKGDYKSAIESYRQALSESPDLLDARFALGRLLATIGEFGESTEEFGIMVAATPEHGGARRGEVTALLFLSRYKESRQKLEEGLAALPRDGQLAHTLARLLAVAPVDEVRDGALAVQLATAVYEVVKLYETGETLSMAYAEAGDFDRAIELQRQLISQAEEEGETARTNGLRQRLLSYQRNEPWRAQSPAEIATATAP